MSRVSLVGMGAALVAGLAATPKAKVDTEGNLPWELSCWIPQHRRGTRPNPERQSKAEKKRAKRAARNLRLAEQVNPDVNGV